MTTRDRQNVYDAIGRERRHQQSTHGGALRSIPAWLLIIESELAEANPRRFLGCELKPEWQKAAVANCEAAIRQREARQRDLFSWAAAKEED